MGRALRNAGRPGIGSEAISAVDIALWDLKARVLGLPLASLLDAARRAGPDLRQRRLQLVLATSGLREQLGGWAAAGIPRVKMKLGRDPDARPRSALDAARDAIGDDVELFVDANGAFTRKQALALGRALRRRLGRALVRGARLLRRPRRPAPRARPRARGHRDRGRRVRLRAADFQRCSMPARRLPAGRRRPAAGGSPGFLRVAALCEARSLDLSAHCAPSISRASVLRRRAAAAPRVLPRPRARRAAALRRRARAASSGVPAARSLAPRERPRAEARGRGAVWAA